MAPRLSVLAVTSQLPWPLDSGGHLRTFHLLKRVSKDHAVRLVAPASPDTADAPDAFQAAGIMTTIVQPHETGRLGQLGRALTAAVHRQPYVLYRRHFSREMAEALATQQRRHRPDVIYLDHLDSFVYALPPDITTIGDLHNVYSRLLARTATEQVNPAVRWYLRREAALLARAERHAARRTDLLMAVSDGERRYFERLGARHCVTVSNGVDCAKYGALPVGRQPNRPIVMFLGAMSWQPNASAAEFLARELVPRLRDEIPDLLVRIVGRDPGRRVSRLADAVDVTGAVDDVMPYLAEAALLAVPLTSGGGTRLKILEAFAAGLPVVSTPVGCEGLNVADGEHLTIAPLERFVDAVRSTLLDRRKALAMAARARALVQARYDWDTVGAVASSAIVAAHERHAASA